MTTGATVSVILLNYKGWADTIACLESFFALDYPSFNIVLVDNASPNDSVERLRDWGGARLDALNEAAARQERPLFRFRESSPAAPMEARDVVLLETGGNLGYAGGNNAGLRYAAANGGFDYAWILNNDTEVDPASLRELVARMEADPAIGLCGSTLCYMDKPDAVQNYAGGSFSSTKGRAHPLGFGASRHDPVDVAAIERALRFVSGASTLISKTCLDAIGPMSEDYFLYYEELDWAERARVRFRLGFAPKSIVYHKVGASIGTNDFGQRSELSDYYLTRNRVKFCRRFAKASLPFVFADIGRDIARHLIAGNTRRAGVLTRAALERAL